MALMDFHRHDDPPELNEWLETANEDHLKCRRWGHSWKEWRFVPHPEDGVRSRTILRCNRCKQKAHDDLDYAGYSSRYIQYDDDYLAPKGMGRIGRSERAQLRLAVDARMMQREEG